MDPNEMEPEIISAFIGAFVVIVALFLTQLFVMLAGRKERRRATLQSWQERLTEWVEEHGHPQGTPPHTHGKLASRQATEMSLRRKDRYVAWWMFEMASEIVTIRSYAGRSLADKESTVHRIGHLVYVAGDSLIAWHHGKLRTEDFDISQKLFQESRVRNIDPYSLALVLGLGSFVEPRRLSPVVKYHLSEIVLRDKTGMAFRMLRPSLQKKLRVYFCFRAISQVIPVHRNAVFLRTLLLIKKMIIPVTKMRSITSEWVRKKAAASVGL